MNNFIKEYEKVCLPLNPVSLSGHIARQVVAEMWAEKCARLEAELEAQRKALEERRAEMERLRKEAQEQEVCLDFMFKGSSM